MILKSNSNLFLHPKFNRNLVLMWWILLFTINKNKRRKPLFQHLCLILITRKEYNFDEEVMQFLFKFNIVEASFTKEQQDLLLNIVYYHQNVFHVQDEALGYCDKLADIIPTITNKPVYLLHRKIPYQLQKKQIKLYLK